MMLEINIKALKPEHMLDCYGKPIEWKDYTICSKTMQSQSNTAMATTANNVEEHSYNS